MPEEIENQITSLEQRMNRQEAEQLTYPLDVTTKAILKREIDSEIEEIIRVVFGGNGSNGELNISSGTTTIALGGVRVYTRNYTSINITGTGALAFSGPHADGTTVILKSQQREVNITSTATRAIDLRNLGGTGGGGGSDFASGGANRPSTPGKGQGIAGAVAPVKFGTGATALAGNGGGGGGCASAGTNGALGTTSTGTDAVGFGGPPLRALSIATLWAESGGGGSGGTGGGMTGGAAGGGGNGGRGAGGLVIECNGVLNFTGTIDASGTAGGTLDAADSSATGNGAGGGGGAGGQVLIAYAALAVNTGTITVTGGAAGAGGSHVDGGTPGAAGAGSAGESLVVEFT